MRFILITIFCLVFSYLKTEASSLPTPRFASLRSDAVNLHVGPGTNYPIEWLYIRKNFPVEIIAVFDTWRQIRDWQGTQGWVHKTLLSGKRTVWVLNKVRPLRDKPDEKSKIIARLEPGVIGRVMECRGNWCKISVKSIQHGIHKGWIKRPCIWGVYPHEQNFG